MHRRLNGLDVQSPNRRHPLFVFALPVVFYVVKIGGDARPSESKSGSSLRPLGMLALSHSGRPVNDSSESVKGKSR